MNTETARAAYADGWLAFQCGRASSMAPQTSERGDWLNGYMRAAANADATAAGISSFDIAPPPAEAIEEAEERLASTMGHALPTVAELLTARARIVAELDRARHAARKAEERGTGITGARMEERQAKAAYDRNSRAMDRARLREEAPRLAREIARLRDALAERDSQLEALERKAGELTERLELAEHSRALAIDATARARLEGAGQ